MEAFFVSAALVAVQDGSVRVLAERVVVDGRRHGELLAVGLQEVLRAGMPELVVVGVGPGPFTGLRVGIVTAAVVADSLGVPAVGVCSLDGLSAPYTGVVTDARRKEVYWATYDGDGLRVDGPTVSAPAVAAQALLSCERVVGDGALLHAGAFGGRGQEPRFPSCARLAEVAVAAMINGSGTGPAGPGSPLPVPLITGGLPLTPLYLRRPDAVATADR